jgi:hypothetical protein
VRRAACAAAGMPRSDVRVHHRRNGGVLRACLPLSTGAAVAQAFRMLQHVPETRSLHVEDASKIGSCGNREGLRELVAGVASAHQLQAVHLHCCYGAEALLLASLANLPDLKDLTISGSMMCSYTLCQYTDVSGRECMLCELLLPLTTLTRIDVCGAERPTAMGRLSGSVWRS